MHSITYARPTKHTWLSLGTVIVFVVFVVEQSELAYERFLALFSQLAIVHVAIAGIPDTANAELGQAHGFTEQLRAVQFSTPQRRRDKTNHTVCSTPASSSTRHEFEGVPDWPILTLTQATTHRAV